MQIIKERLDIDGVLEKRIKNVLKFLNIKSKIIKGNIIHIPKTNIAYNDELTEEEKNRLSSNGIDKKNKIKVLK